MEMTIIAPSSSRDTRPIIIVLGMSSGTHLTHTSPTTTAPVAIIACFSIEVSGRMEAIRHSGRCMTTGGSVGSSKAPHASQGPVLRE